MSAVVDALRRRLAEPLPGLEAQVRMAPRPRMSLDAAASGDLRRAAALLLLYEHGGQWHIPLTLRTGRLRHHTGQVSLPGGRLDPGETPQQTAVREAYEEIGVRPETVAVVGALTPVPIPVSAHLLHPIVGVALSRPQFVVAEHEVERLIEVPLSHLRQPEAVRTQTRQRTLPPPGPMEVPYFEVENVEVWGATAMILAEFLAVIADVDGF